MSQLYGMAPLALMFVVLYFVMIRPQMKRQKEHRSMIEALAKGDEVATSGGIIGRVTRMSEQFLHIEIASGVEVQIQDRKSTRLNSSHLVISYAVFCLKKKT